MENIISGDAPYIISVDAHLQSFKQYIENNNRAILSARFGDGKSFFLNEFQTKYSSDYEFLTLYPVNYQVADNKDVFEYIKRDILLQLLNMVELEESDFSESMYLYSYMNDNAYDLISDLLGSVRYVGKAIEILMKNLQKYEEYKKGIQAESNPSSSFLARFESQQGGIYEFDSISDLIYKCVIKLKANKPDKNIVLVIEDLDRIDPAHIFRILNIISAHMDYQDVGKSDTQTRVMANKFGFDNIILVCDYDNIKSIFHHFYGVNTDFTGYIGKFSTAIHYQYTLKDNFVQYIIDNLPPEISEYEALSEAFANLVYQNYIKEDRKEERLKTIKSNLSCPLAFGGSELLHPASKEILNCQILLKNRLSDFVLLLKRFKILDDFSEKYIIIPGSNDSPQALVLYELIHLIGYCWFLISKYDKNTSASTRYDRTVLLFYSSEYASIKFEIHNDSKAISDLFSRDSTERTLSAKRRIVEIAQKIINDIVPKDCY